MTLYAATDHGLVRVTRHGDAWMADRPLDVRSALSVAADPRQPARVFCGTARHGIWRSDDAGASWRPVFKGMPSDPIWSLAVSGAERVNGQGVVYAGTEPSAVFRSEDAGETWRKCEALAGLPSSGEWSFPPRPTTHHARWIETDPHAAGRLYVAIEAGALIRSPDGGGTWQDRVPGGPYDTHQLVTHAAAPGRLWSAAGDGFYESADAGGAWRKAEQGLGHRYCWSVAIDSTDPGVVVLSAAAGPWQAHDASRAEAHLYRRATDGGSWGEVSDGLPDPTGTRAYALGASPAEPGVFYAGTDGALYQSSDAGASWRRLPVDWPSGYAGRRIHVLMAAEPGSKATREV